MRMNFVLEVVDDRDAALLGCDFRPIPGGKVRRKNRLMYAQNHPISDSIFTMTPAP